MLGRNRLRASLVCLPLLLFPAGLSHAQEVVPRYSLEVTKETPVGNLSAASLVLPNGCDSRGNIYIRFNTANMFTSPIVKLSSEGERKAQFSTDMVKDWSGADIYDYAIGSDGQVYLLVAQMTKEKKLEFGVLTFDDEGHHRFSIRLNPSFESVDHLAVLSGGAFLIAGFRKVEEANPRIPGTPDAEQPKAKPQVEPVLLIVNRNGEEAREVSLLTEYTIHQQDSSAPKLRVPASAVKRASMVAGDDGNLYLLIPEGKPTIYVISGGGEVLRTLKVEPPVEKAVPLNVTLAPGAGLLLTTADKIEQKLGAFYPGDKTFFSLINTETGERLYDYQSNSKLGSALACYTPQGMLFPGSSNGKLVIRKATFH